jgi:Tfp pilus assembly protein PilF
MEYYRRALMIKPAPEVYRKTARCAEISGDKAIAIAICRQIPPEQRNYDDNITLGRLYAKDNRFKEAEESFSQAIKSDTEKIEGYIYLALLYLDNNNPEPAEKLLQIALEKAPDEGAIHFFLGCIYYSEKQIELAREEMKKAGSFSKTDILKRYSAKFQDFLSSRAR